MKYNTPLLLIMVLFIFGSCSLEHKYRVFKNTFEKDIQKLERLTDHLEKDDYLLFIGSSSIRLWNTIEEDMAPYSVVKRGYGGAHYYDLIHYVDRLVEGKEKAKAVVIFVANDITGRNSWDKLHKDLTPQQVKELFKAIAKKIHHNLSPKIPIYVIETTPTPSRWKVWNQIATANDFIKSHTEKNTNLQFISTRDSFINQRGVPEGKYFVKDSLHLSQKGYELWEKIIKKALTEKFIPIKKQ
ncbi:MAG: GDSL-type esterase/lipase family protein [Flavobacteriaceae bacterium]|jgi:lysophospholipase L1-like esterase